MLHPPVQKVTEADDADSAVPEPSQLGHSEHDCITMQALAASGKLGKLKVDDLKVYLKVNGLKVTGKKDELIQRITEHMEGQK